MSNNATKPLNVINTIIIISIRVVNMIFMCFIYYLIYCNMFLNWCQNLQTVPPKIELSRHTSRGQRLFGERSLIELLLSLYSWIHSK